MTTLRCAATRTTLRHPAGRAFGIASAALVGSAVLAHIALARAVFQKAKGPANATRSVDAPSPNASVTLPNGATLHIKCVIGRVGGSEKDAVWQGDGATGAEPGERISEAIGTFAPTLSSSMKLRSVIIETQITETKQPNFRWAGGDTPDGVRLLANQPADGKHYFFQPVTEERSFLGIGTFSIDVIPESHSAKNTKNADGLLRYVSDGVLRCPKEASQTAVRVVVAAGDWSDVIRCPIKPGDTLVSSPRGRVHFNFDPQPQLLSDVQGRSLEDCGCVQISDHFPEHFDELEREVVAVDQTGNIVAFPKFTSEAPGKVEDQENGTPGRYTAVYFPRAALPKIAEFRLLMRPFYTATFHNVALEPQANAQGKPVK